MKNTGICLLVILLLFGFTNSCNYKQRKTTDKRNNENTVIQTTTFELDEYSYASKSKAVITHLDLDIKVDFESKSISGKAVYTIDNSSASDKIYFDTQYLRINKISTDQNEVPANYKLGEYEEYKGRELEIDISQETKTVTIHYSDFRKI